MKRKVGPDSTRPTQRQEGDVANMGGTAPGGIVAFMGAASQWASSNAAARSNFPTPATPRVGNMYDTGSMRDVSKHFAGQAVDQAPDIAHGSVAIHPGFMPGKFRTGSDANPRSPRGMENDPTANDGRPLSPDRRHRGESPMVPKQTRGPYRP